MGRSLIDQMRKLRRLFWSQSDPIGRGFVPLAEVHRRLGELDEAERVLQDGLERHPDLASGHVVAGRVYLDQGADDRAEEAFGRALDLDPRNVEALRSLGKILKKNGDVPGCLELSRRLVEEEPWNQGLRNQIQELEAQIHTGQRALPGEEAPGRHEEEAAKESEVEAPEQRVEEGPEQPRGPWDRLNGAEIATELNWEGATLQADSSLGLPGEDGGGLMGSLPSEVPTRSRIIEGQDYLLEDAPRGPEPEADSVADPDQRGALVTRTLGEIYLRQGLLEKAEGVFKELLKRRPGDQELQARLAEVNARKAGGDAGPVVPIQDLAPEGPIPIEFLAPEAGKEAESRAPAEILPIAALAPEGPGRSGPGPTGEVVPIGFLAPEYPLGLESDVPGGPMLIEALAPDEVVSIESLAPDRAIPPKGGREGPGGPNEVLDDFKDWLDNLS
ncbi:tetratricopeptide repeat protein [Gemmatimonadota bacterium]